MTATIKHFSKNIFCLQLVQSSSVKPVDTMGWRYFKNKSEFFQYLTRWKGCCQLSARFLQFLEEPTFQLTLACPKIIWEGLCRRATLTKSLGEAEEYFSSFLYLALFQSFFLFHKSSTHFIHAEKRALPLEFTFLSFWYGCCVSH